MSSAMNSPWRDPATSGWPTGISRAINESMSDVFGEFIDQSQGVDDDSAWDS